MRFTEFFFLFIGWYLPLSSQYNSSSEDVSTNEIPNVDTDVRRLESRIVNGTKAEMGQFPHQVSLRRSYSNLHFCGGSIIDEDWVLTAAHCMYKSNGVQITPWTIKVTAGHVRLNQTDDYVQSRYVTTIIIHENFEPSTLTNDIALLKLKAPFELHDKYVKPAELTETMPEPGAKCKVSGWGYLSEDKLIVSNDLMYINLPLISPSRCKELLVNVTNLPSGMYCAGYEEGLRDACQGDSGGGMICGDTLTGIVSGGEGCARPGLPGLYTDVPYYRYWVAYQIINYVETTEFTGDKHMLFNSEETGHGDSSRIRTTFSLFALLSAYLCFVLLLI